MFVASAVRGGMPNRIMAGTVINAVPPVTTVTTHVRKNIAPRAISAAGLRSKTLRGYHIGLMIKAIIFDLGRVIVPFDFKRGYARMEALCGIPAAEIPGRIAPTGLVRRFESGQIEPRDFVAQLSGNLNLNVSYEDFCEIWSSIFLPETLVPEDLLRELRRNYRLILLSNTNAIHFEMIRARYPLLRHFHAFVLSYEVGAMKPAPAIYQKAIAEAQCRPEECFFTDDIAEYVEAAREQGIDAVQFQSCAQIEQELKRRGMVWGA
jgi:glucose-1-phosphatase